MSRYTVRFTPEAEDDLLRLYGFLLAKDLGAATRAPRAIRRGIGVLRFSPHSCRGADAEHRRLRELVIPFRAAGFVVLLEVESPRTVTILAVRHPREDDSH